MQIRPYTPQNLQNRQTQPNFKAKHSFTTKGNIATDKMSKLFDEMQVYKGIKARTFRINLDPKTKSLQGVFRISFKSPQNDTLHPAEQAFVTKTDALFKKLAAQNRADTIEYTCK